MIWKPNPFGNFSLKSFYEALESSSGEAHPFSIVYIGLVPPRVEVFCWLAAAERISTVDILGRRGFSSIALSSICASCGKENKSISFIYSLWSHV